MSGLKHNYDSDHEISENHPKLIDAIKKFDKSQRVKKPDRSEPSLEVSEFHLVKSGITNEHAVEIINLAKVLKEKEYHTDIAKQINATKIKANVIQKPVEKPTAERIKRVVGYENSKKELARWTGVIARNRTAASVTFPLSQSSMKLESTNEYTKRFRMQSELEQKLAESEPVENIADDKDNFSLTLQDIVKHRKEAAKFRAQQSYKEIKAYRQNKIKSKKFHRIQRQKRIRKSLNEYEELQKIDPYTALEKLEQLERTRVKERMTLRHKSTGQWAKSKQFRAKFDSNSRQMLAEQLSISRELTQKIKTNGDSEDDDNHDQQTFLQGSNKDNPWIELSNSEPEVDKFIIGYRKYWDKLNKIKTENNVKKDDIKKKELENKNFFLSQDSEKIVIKESSNSNEKNFNICKLKKKMYSMKKLYKNSKHKLGKKLFKNAIKMKTLEEKSGTSYWLVSSSSTLQDNILNGSEDIDIDHIFETVNDKLQNKLGKKCSKLKRMLDQETDYSIKIKNKKRKNISTYDIEKLSLKGQTKVKAIFDHTIEETKNLKSFNVNVQTDHIVRKTKFDNCVTLNSKTTEIDPNKFINIKPKYLKTHVFNNVRGDEVLENEDAIDQHDLINEAFADDNVKEFRDEKCEEMKKGQAEDVNLNLPGWGSWGGKDIKQSSGKKRHFIIKESREELRRNENNGDVVLIEEKNAKIKQHLVSELPFPFTTVQDFEASMRAPLGRDFVPEKIFNKLIQPAIKTKVGKIIEPITESVLIKTENLKKREMLIKEMSNVNKETNKS